MLSKMTPEVRAATKACLCSIFATVRSDEDVKILQATKGATDLDAANKAVADRTLQNLTVALLLSGR